QVAASCSYRLLLHHSFVAPPPGSPLPATPSWHALSSSCLWSSKVLASPAALACPALPSLRQEAAACSSSLLLVSLDDCSPADSPHGRSVSSSASGSARTFLSCVCTLKEVVSCQVAVGSGAARGAASGGAEPGGAESEGAGSGGAEPRGAASSGGPAGASPRLSLQQLREWFVRRPRLRSGATGAGGTRDAGAGGAGVTAGAGGAGGTVATESGGSRTRGTGAAGTSGVEGAGAGDPMEPGAAGAGGAGVAGAGAVDPGAGGARDTVRPRPYFISLLQQVFGVPSSTSFTPPLLCPPLNQSQLPLQPASPLPAPSPYTEQSGGLRERREPASHPVLLVRTAHRGPRSRPPPVPGTHALALRPSFVPLHVPLPAPPESSLPEVPDPEPDSARAASPTLAHYATALVAESESACPPSIGGECALGTDVLEDRQEEFEFLAAAVPRFASMLLAPEGDPHAPDIPAPCSYAEAIEGPYSSQWQAAMDAEMASWKSTGTYVDEVPPQRRTYKRQGVDYFQTFSPTPKMTTLRVFLHVAAQRDYELHSLDFSIAFLQGSMHEEIWLRRPPGFTESFLAVRTTLAALGFAPATANPSLFLRTNTSLPPFYVLVYVDDLVFATADNEALTLVKSKLQKRHTCTDLGEQCSYLGLQITQDRARRTITLTQSHMVHQVLQRFGFQFSSPLPTPLSTSHSLSSPPLDESVELSGPYLELVGCLMYLMTCTRPDLAYPLSLLARYVAFSRHRKVHWDAAKRVLRYLCSTSGMGLVLGGRGPVVLTGHADASWVGEDFQAVAADVQANPMAVLLDNDFSHHMMGTKVVFVEIAPSDGVKHVRGFNGALQPIEGRGTVALQGEAGKRVLIPDVLYIPGVQANLLSADQLKESGMQLQSDVDEILLVAATWEVVALRTIVSATKSTPNRLHARLAHAGVDTIKSSAKHEVATGLNIKPSTRADLPCVSCVGGKLVRHTFPDKGSDAKKALAVVHIDMCGPFRVAAKDGSLYFLVLKDRHTRLVWVMPVAKKSDVLREFQKWLVLVERQAKKSVLMPRSDRGGEFLGKEFTDFVNGKGIVHNLTCPYTPQQNGMAEREMRTAVKSVRTMLLHMGVHHHWWHIALRQAVWVCNCLERSTTPPGRTPYQLLTRKKDDLTLARVWGCMVQFMGWEVLDLTDNKVVTSVEVIFYKTLSLEVWKEKFGPASGRTQAHPPTDTSTATAPLLAEVDEPADEDVLEVLPPPLVLAPPFPVADRPASTPVSATGDERSLEASPVAPASGIAGGQQGAKLVDQDRKSSTIGEQQTGEPVEQVAAAGVQSTGEQQTGRPTGELPKSAGGSKQLVDDLAIDKEGELLAG
ncbi:unnamed protein product, partial [Closterium sp. NIES-54]